MNNSCKHLILDTFCYFVVVPRSGSLEPSGEEEHRREGQLDRGVGASCEGNFLSARSKNRPIDPGCNAKRPERAFAGVEKSRVAHDVANSLWRSDDLGATAGGLEDAQHPGVENGHNLSQSCRDRDFADAQYEFVQDMLDAAAVSFRLAGSHNFTNP